MKRVETPDWARECAEGMTILATYRAPNGWLVAKTKERQWLVWDCQNRFWAGYGKTRTQAMRNASGPYAYWIWN